MVSIFRIVASSKAIFRISSKSRSSFPRQSVERATGAHPQCLLGLLPAKLACILHLLVLMALPKCLLCFMTLARSFSKNVNS